MLKLVRPNEEIGRAEIDGFLLDLSERCDPSPICRIIAEHLASGGARVRARLAYATCRIAGQGHASARAVAACVEALHQASLVHDDLTDRSETRRGRAAVWAAHGDAVALATGDHLVSLAFCCLAEARDIDPRRALLEVHRAVSATIRGQCADLARGPALRDGRDAPRDPFAAWSRMAVQKAGPLLALGPDLALPAGRATELAALHGACRRLALGYQALDDISDAAEDRAEGRTANLCLRLEAAGLTGAEARDSALLHAERELGRAARGAAAVPGELGQPLARLCLRKLREAEVLADAV
ncbi:MAG: polyprenyl synthetase family protein [Roseicyclus sp.]